MEFFSMDAVYASRGSSSPTSIQVYKYRVVRDGSMESAVSGAAIALKFVCQSTSKIMMKQLGQEERKAGDFLL